MNKLIFNAIKTVFLSSLLVFVSCNNKEGKKDKLEGVWEQTNFFRLKEKDTILKDNSKIQHKIYLDGFLIWNSDAGKDSVEWHAYGTYNLKKDTLIETLTSMSIPLQGYNSIYPIVIEVSDSSLKQTINYKENDINYQNIEIYKKLN
ncbi:hypothetical protein [Polaribacter sargassicola]|uniref:hypothetical protein n=1 Tax=Polaribacter sargassicola TaxID=2836891 RepID=UPI001F1A8701|nr:hypothetical protein [Polaribacter sp. DS7-9]MCG1036062.1 hypothetical protein [Polaribacter sp. DS7-9]